MNEGMANNCKYDNITAFLLLRALLSFVIISEKEVIYESDDNNSLNTVALSLSFSLLSF